VTCYGTSTCTTDRLRSDEAFDLIAAAGFTEIELSGYVGCFERWEARPAAYLGQRLNASGLWARTVHVHGPGWPLGDPDEARRTAALDAAAAARETRSGGDRCRVRSYLPPQVARWA